MSHHGSRPPIREFNEQWVVNIPELRTRSTLLESIKIHKDVRRKIFQCAQAMESIALIPDHNLAEYCLSLWWREQRKELHHRYADKLRTRTGADTLFNEMFGCLRNVYYNARRKANPNCKLEIKRYRHHDSDVVREYI